MESYKKSCQRALEFSFDSDLKLKTRVEKNEWEFAAFLTEDSKIAIFDVIENDFTPLMLSEYVEIAEDFCKRYDTQTNVFLIMPKDILVLVHEFDIKSEYDFTIKVARQQEDIVETILHIIQRKIAQGKELDEDDIKMLEYLPMMTKDLQRRKIIRAVVFDIMTQLGL